MDAAMFAEINKLQSLMNEKSISYPWLSCMDLIFVTERHFRAFGNKDVFEERIISSVAEVGLKKTSPWAYIIDNISSG